MFNKKLIQRLYLILILIILILINTGTLIIFSFNQRTFTVKAASIWIQTSDLDFNNGTLDNVSIIGESENSKLILKEIASEFCYWSNKTPQEHPSLREDHAIANIYGTDKVILFGGYYYNFSTNSKHYYNDTWIYDLSDNTWTEKKLRIKPNARDEHAMAPIYGTYKIVLFGGFYSDIFNNNYYYNDTWIYDLSDNTWSEIIITGNKPTGRAYHKMVSVHNDDKVILFGGEELNWLNHVNDTWVYDLSKNTWTKKMPINKPSSRMWHGMASIYGRNDVLLFGGFDGDNNNETWVYNLSNNNWIKRNPLNTPCGRKQPVMASIYQTNKVILFGGFNGMVFNDTWIYNLSDNNWTKKTFSTKPEARHCHAMTTIYGTKKILLFGGLNYTNSKYYDDTWIFTQSHYLYNGTFISTPYDIGFNSSFKTINWNADIPNNTSINFQLRSASNEIEILNKKFLGPDGTIGTYYKSSPTIICSDHDKDKWLQFKVFISTNEGSQTPILHNVTINYNHWPYEPILKIPMNKIWINNSKLKFTWIFNDRDSYSQGGFQLEMDDKIDFSSINYNSGEIYSNISSYIPSFTITDGIWYWRVKTQDSDGDWGAYSTPWKIFIDTKPPNSTLTFPINNGSYNNLQTISGTAFDSQIGLGINKVEIAIKMISKNHYWNGTDWNFKEIWLLADGTTNWVYDSSNIPWISSTNYLIQSRATDNVTNMEIPSNGIVFYIDMDSPASSINIPENDTWLNNLNTISGSAIDIGGSSIKKVEISIRQTKNIKYWDGTGWNINKTWLTTIGTFFWSYNTSNIRWSTDSQYIIQSRTTDNVGNIEIPDIGITFGYDDKPPDISILINNGNKYTNSSKVTLSLTAEDFGSGVSQTAYSIDGITWLNWQRFNTTKLVDLPEDDGEKSVFFRVEDRANNIEMKLNTIILDTTPPYSLSISINNGNSETNSTLVILKLKALDALSGVYQMSFSTNGNNWSKWENFTEIKSYTLSSDNGEKTVYFKVKDQAGNIADPLSDTILLNTISSMTNDEVPEKSLSNIDILIFLIIILIFIIIIIILMKKRKNRLKQDSLPPKTTTLKSIEQKTFTQQIRQVTSQPKLESTENQPKLAQEILPLSQQPEPSISEKSTVTTQDAELKVTNDTSREEEEYRED